MLARRPIRSFSSRAQVTLRARSVLLAAAVSLVCAPVCAAQTITVDSKLDSVSKTDGACSLREALIAASSNTGADAGHPHDCPAGQGADEVVLPAGQFTLSIAAAGGDDGTTGDLLLSDGTTLTGAGARTTTINAARIDRVLSVAGTGNVVRGLKITGGKSKIGTASGFFGPPGLPGGGVNVPSGAAVTIQDTAIVDNRTGDGGAGGSLGSGFSGQTGGSGGAGGGIAVAGTATLQRVLIASNVTGAGGVGGAGGPGDIGVCNGSAGGDGGTGGAGGGVDVTGTLVATDSTLTANSVSTLKPAGGIGGSGSLCSDNSNGSAGQHGSPGTGGSAGAIHVGAGITTLTRTTLAGDVAPAPGAEVIVSPTSSATATLTLGASIVHATGVACAAIQLPGGGLAKVTDGGFNVVSDASCPGLLGDGQLSALADHGGPTDTMVPTAATPPLDHVPATSPLCADADQRGIARPQGGACDAGAVEIAVAPVPTPTPAPTPTPTPTPGAGAGAGQNTTITALPIAGASFGAALGLEFTKVSRSGRTLKVRVANANPFAVSGTFTVKLGSRTLGTATFTLLGSGEAPVSLHLSRANAKRVATAKSRRRITLVTTATPPSGKARTATLKLT